MKYGFGSFFSGIVVGAMLIIMVIATVQLNNPNILCR